MNYLSVEMSLQEAFKHAMPLSPAQTGRIAKVCNAILLAGEVPLTKIARFLKGDTQQDSRVRWIKRLLEADFMTQERVYQPLLKQALLSFHENCWHMVIDRTALWEGVDLATISLNYHKRAIPFSSINILAFYQPHSSPIHRDRGDVCYLTTSLPLTASLRRLGRRRWGTEPFYRDYKSAGWSVTASQLETPQRQEGLLILLALNYLWTVCIGRWLCKTLQRRQVDSQPIRHLSLFRIGWVVIGWNSVERVCEFKHWA